MRMTAMELMGVRIGGLEDQFVMLEARRNTHIDPDNPETVARLRRELETSPNEEAAAVLAGAAPHAQILQQKENGCQESWISKDGDCTGQHETCRLAAQEVQEELRKSKICWMRTCGNRLVWKACEEELDRFDSKTLINLWLAGTVSKEDSGTVHGTESVGNECIHNQKERHWGRDRA